MAHDFEVPGKADIEAAADRIKPYARRTMIFTSGTVDDMVGAKLFFKCENFQKVGAFKFRGACNAVFSLSDIEARNGVATHSSGNHAQALSLAARLRGVKAFIVMPSNSPKVKVEAVKSYEGQITFCEPNLDARQAMLAKLLERHRAKFIHPYDNPRVIAGQATAAKELMEDVHSLDVLMAPVGGGGLLSGTALAAHFWSPNTKVVGAEPAGADDAYRSFKSGKLVSQTDPQTIADGLRTSLSERTFHVIQHHVSDIVTVSEDGIRQATRLAFERMKMVIEPSAAVPLGALLEGKLDVRGKRVGIIVSGGNVDADVLKSIIW